MTQNRLACQLNQLPAQLQSLQFLDVNIKLKYLESYSYSEFLVRGVGAMVLIPISNKVSEGGMNILHRCRGGGIHFLHTKKKT